MIKDSVDGKTFWHIGNLPYLPYCRVWDLVNLHHVCECVVTSNGIMEVSQWSYGDPYISSCCLWQGETIPESISSKMKMFPKSGHWNLHCSVT